MKALLIGESNPYGADPYYALYPNPKNSAGYRLCHLIMGLDTDEYLREYRRVNLCCRAWSVREAREHAARLVREFRSTSALEHVVLVLLGSKVTQAFGIRFEPFTTTTDHNLIFVQLPHPSGLSRLWYEPGSFERARQLLRASGVL